jgi:hypothetical protein
MVDRRRAELRGAGPVQIKRRPTKIVFWPEWPYVSMIRRLLRGSSSRSSHPEAAGAKLSPSLTLEQYSRPPSRKHAALSPPLVVVKPSRNIPFPKDPLPSRMLPSSYRGKLLPGKRLGLATGRSSRNPHAGFSRRSVPARSARDPTGERAVRRELPQRRSLRRASDAQDVRDRTIFSLVTAHIPAN